MSQAIVTSRSLKNEDTGIDITVPEFKEVSGRFGLTNEEEFRIIVISRLSYFKTERHSPSDVVQFMVTRRFSEFENFRKAMDEKFSATVFPELPKRSLVMSDGMSGSKRRTACQEFLQFISGMSKISSSSLFLEFLGVKLSKIKDINEGKTLSTEEPGPTKEKTETTKKIKPKSTSSADLFGEGEESDEDLFGELDSAERQKESEDLFRDGDLSNGKLKDRTDAGMKSSDHGVRLFEDETDANVFLPPGASGDTDAGIPLVTEDIGDILSIEDDLDALLLKAKPKPSPKPSSVRTNIDSKATVPVDVQADVDLDNDDILKYIAENVDTPSASLF